MVVVLVFFATLVMLMVGLVVAIERRHRGPGLADLGAQELQQFTGAPAHDERFPRELTSPRPTTETKGELAALHLPG